MFAFDFQVGGDSAEPKTLESRTLEAVADYIKSGDVKRITVLTGAGLSTAAGIPDFRSPGTGLYANLARLNLPYAEAVFDIDYFRQHPEPFYFLAKELYPGKFHPTISHSFIALLARKGLLEMLFTQNIDCLERRAGVPGDKIIEAHGSFATQRCIGCSRPFPDDSMRLHVEAEIVPHCDECDGLVKPDIVFFGEALPQAFRDNIHLPSRSDLLIVIGTSLTVFPFAGLPEYVSSGVPRLLLNNERVGQIGRRSDDVVQLGSCDAGVRKLATLLGWRDELDELWRSTVGHKEAERQLSLADDPGDDLEAEIRKMTEGVDKALRLEEEPDDQGDPGPKSSASPDRAGVVERIARALGERIGIGTKDAGPQSGKGRNEAPGSQPEGQQDGTSDVKEQPTPRGPEEADQAASTAISPPEDKGTTLGDGPVTNLGDSLPRPDVGTPDDAAAKHSGPEVSPAKEVETSEDAHTRLKA